MKNVFGGAPSLRRSRKAELMGDAAYVVVTASAPKTSGLFLLDDEVMASVGVTDFSKYRCDPALSESDLMIDFFC